MPHLRVIEIFRSIQGESTRAGLPCSFVRLAGCNLRCTWCDSKYAQADGEAMSLEAVMDKVVSLGLKRVEVTGGEPLCQPASLELMSRLADAGYETLVETNGSRDISAIDPRVIRIVDFKCPSSGQSEQNLWSNVQALTSRDEVKFVVAGRADFDFAAEAIRRHGLTGICPVILSPVAGRCDAAELGKWILDSGLDVRLGMQLHKIIWPGVDRGV